MDPKGTTASPNEPGVEVPSVLSGIFYVVLLDLFMK